MGARECTLDSGQSKSCKQQRIFMKLLSLWLQLYHCYGTKWEEEGWEYLYRTEDFFFSFKLGRLAHQLCPWQLSLIKLSWILHLLRVRHCSGVSLVRSSQAYFLTFVNSLEVTNYVYPHAYFIMRATAFPGEQRELN